MGCITKENEDAEDEADDTFDLKTRLEFETRSRSSGRRHTVANIGLPGEDLADLGRGSVARDARHRLPPKGRASSRTAEYHYVRKWSVDIAALANQLENPKAHGDTSPFKERGEEEEHAKSIHPPPPSPPLHPLLHPPPLANITSVVASCEYIGPGTASAEATRGEGGGVSKPIPPSRRESNGREDPPTDAPAVATTADGKELTALAKTVTLVVLSLLAMLPCVAVFVWLSVSPLKDLQLVYNLSLVAEMVMTLVAAVNPVLLFWVDRRLRRRLRNLLREAAHLRCVCYCNVGRHGNCIRSVKASTDSPPKRTSDGNRPTKI